jgi:DNA mismatch endonuclease (patch repair protein)
MSKIRGKNTGIELKLMKAMRVSGITRFVYQKKMFGNPDFVFEKQRVAVFCDGDFWHGYRFNKWKGKLNKFWIEKISTNIKRDGVVSRTLEKEKWHVIRFWEHQIKKDPKKCVDKVANILVMK